MKTASAIAVAFALMFLTLPAHSAESTASFEAIADTADSIAFFNGRCATWRDQVVCAF